MPPHDLTILPPPSEIFGLARAGFNSLAPEQLEFRRELGLPADRPVIMSGHQLAVWHPGILAKWLVTAAAAEHGFAPAWVWVDQDANDFGEVRYPARTAGSAAGPALLEARLWRFTPMLTGHHPVAAVPAFEPMPIPALQGASFATAETAPALERIGQALAAGREKGATAAEQMHHALLELLATVEPSPPPHVLFATRLARTPLFSHLVSRMRENPRACTDAYNAAVAAVPDGHAADVAMLHTGVNHTRGPELPLWHILSERSAPRERIHAADLGRIPMDELAPRGLLMTGLLRLAACDMFIHGTGGGGPEGYDRITKHWFAHWLGETIAPTAVVTATLRLDFGEVETADGAALARALWLAHHARHHPSLIGDPAAAARKRGLVAQIAGLPRHDPQRPKLFREMHALLDASRRLHAAATAALDRSADAAAIGLRNAAVAAERDWPFPLYTQAQLAALRSAARGAVAQQPTGAR